MILIRGSKWWNVQVACLVGKHQTPLRHLAIGPTEVSILLIVFLRKYHFVTRVINRVNLPKSCMRAFNGNNF